MACKQALIYFTIWFNWPLAYASAIFSNEIGLILLA